jgi:hypothetical protein
MDLTMTDQLKNDQQGDLVERLVRLAESGPEVPAHGADRVKAAIRPLWHSEVKARNLRIGTRWTVAGLAAAAMVALVILVLPLRTSRTPESLAPAGFIELVRGTVEITVPGAAPALVASGESHGIQTGSWLETDVASRAALRLADGPALRMDSNSRARLVSARVVELERGAVYVDSSGARFGGIEVRTPFGVARDIGTQFEVRRESDALIVRVRQGSVSLRGPSGNELRIGSGTAVSMAPDGRHRTIAFTGDEWSWMQNVSPPPLIEGKPVAALLGWISSETGLAIRYADRESERLAAETLLHGNLGELRPDQAAEAVLPSAGLEVTREPGVLIVRRVP